MADVVYDPDAIYGFSPSPDSVRLGAYLTLDWTGPELVEKGIQERIAYFESVAELSGMVRAAYCCGA